VAIYNAYLPTLGGGELCTLALARALAARGHEVDLLALPGRALGDAYAHFGLAPPPERVRLIELGLARHADEARERSAGYDLFFNLTHYSTVPSRARRGILWPWFPLRPEELDGDREFLASYDRVLATSRYAALWMRRWWDVDATVLHPPVMPIEAPPTDTRDRSIVVVGRFNSDPHPKRQLELVRAFAEAGSGGPLAGWTLHLVGGAQPRDAGYLDAVRTAAAGSRTRLWVDVSRDVIVGLLRAAAIVWQATGWGCDPEGEPERFEHFGIGLVEAMSAGAVPIALGNGGVEEIVRDGMDGVLWGASTGPVPATAALAADADRLTALSSAARARAAAFGPERFHAALDRVLAGA
jgi:glycosyltransferase involved in cell wall biosynthesis